MKMAWDVERALKVNANAYHVYIACMLARLMETGVLGLNVLREASEHTGRCMAEYVSVHGLSFESAEEALQFLNDLMGFTDELVVEQRGGSVEVRLDRESCRICPRDTGGLESPLTACPLIGFVKGYLEGLGLLKLKERYDMERGEMPAKQEDGQCIFAYPIAKKKAETKKRQESRPQAK
ncbi:hypothetical protein N186_01185 [Thermofilum adornatum]|uniref:4-vinyl reductase 4VR domain-containing protein n=3 Tax=Thermofilum adornatum TaxID=1365176 RepID=S5ZC82_9CREN|nr:hypothetical protein N186_01185 [Thermofilum adornatum]